jgi:hypothetical protein
MRTVVKWFWHCRFNECKWFLLTPDWLLVEFRPTLESPWRSHWTNSTALIHLISKCAKMMETYRVRETWLTNHICD